MKTMMRSLQRLVFGETWTIPIGVGLAIALGLVTRAAVPPGAWQRAGGFALAIFVVGTLAWSLRERR